MASLFSDELMEKNSGLTIEIVAENFSYFHEQSHLYHLQTKSYAEHKALDLLYSDIVGIKDEILEKMQGYLGRNLKSYKVRQLLDYAPGKSNQLVQEIISFAKKLEDFGEQNNMPDIENLAQGLSGFASRIKYLLTLS